jgi:hypothetical protein
MWKDTGRRSSIVAAGEQHAAQPERLDPPEVVDPVGGRAHGGLADAEETVGVRAAVLGEPAVVRVHARLLVVQVRMAAEHQADGRVEDLGADAVALLVREACLGIPAAAVPLLEAACHPDVLGAFARGRDEAHGERALRQVGDHVHVAARVVVDEVRRPVAERRVDVLPVRVRVLGDVGVGRDRQLGHVAPPSLRGLEHRGQARDANGRRCSGMGSGPLSVRPPVVR